MRRLDQSKGSRIAPAQIKGEDNMDRRNILLRATAAIGAAFAASRAQAATETPAAGKLKVVYHLNDLDKVGFVLGNIDNHFQGVGGPDNVTIALVIHGPALRAFHAASANPDVSKRVGQFSKAGLEMAACGNTMKSQRSEEHTSE